MEPAADAANPLLAYFPLHDRPHLGKLKDKMLKAYPWKLPLDEVGEALPMFF